MKKILFPSSLIELSGVAQQCLLVAKEQGFDIENIELGVSPIQSIHLVDDHNSIHIISDLIAEHDIDSEHSFALYYRSKFSVEACANQPKEAIFIGVSDDQGADQQGEHRQLDIWRHPINGEVRALSIQSKFCSVFVPEQHLAWVVTCLLLDFPIEDALTLARGMLAQHTDVSRETNGDSSCICPQSNQWAYQYSHFPTPLLKDKRLNIDIDWSMQANSAGFPTLAKSSLGLYPVVDDIFWLERLLPLGIKTIQLRIKNAQQADLEHQIIRAVELGHQYNAQVFINDYWQLAVKHGAFGVHLGQEDIEQSNLELIANAGLRLGLSTHGYYELLRIVQIHPSYIALGHIFPTTTKEMPSKPQGLVRLSLYQKLLNSIPYCKSEQYNIGDCTIVGYPTVAIGGIDLSNADQVWRTGVSSLAVVRAIILAKSPAKVIESFAELMAESQDEDVESYRCTARRNHVNG